MSLNDESVGVHQVDLGGHGDIVLGNNHQIYNLIFITFCFGLSLHQYQSPILIVSFCFELLEYSFLVSWICHYYWPHTLQNHATLPCLRGLLVFDEEASINGEGYCGFSVIFLFTLLGGSLLIAVVVELSEFLCARTPLILEVVFRTCRMLNIKLHIGLVDLLDGR